MYILSCNLSTARDTVKVGNRRYKSVNLKENPVIQTYSPLALPQYVSRNNVAIFTSAKSNERRLLDKHLNASCDPGNGEIFSKLASHHALKLVYTYSTD